MTSVFFSSPLMGEEIGGGNFRAYRVGFLLIAQLRLIGNLLTMAFLSRLL